MCFVQMSAISQKSKNSRISFGLLEGEGRIDVCVNVDEEQHDDMSPKQRDILTAHRRAPVTGGFITGGGYGILSDQGFHPPKLSGNPVRLKLSDDIFLGGRNLDHRSGIGTKTH